MPSASKVRKNKAMVAMPNLINAELAGETSSARTLPAINVPPQKSMVRTRLK